MSKIHEADLDRVATYAAELPNAWLLCRELGHNWGPHSARVVDGGGFDRVLRCRRCPTRRHQVLDAYGRIVSNSYDYPEGYQMPAGQGRITGDGRGVLRVTSIRHDIEAADQRAAKRRTAAAKPAATGARTVRPARPARGKR
ncbi:hypothetical protein [Streptomyces sp. SID3343]|uniref:hypothetical protein n=1 Tax=Streptomyces sp. SID3343 TaxID=2690260 RepID=UPI001368E105|nr:hypothetical protein [Streptomyces sp. SID3343]MYV98002.1 hypothetical protein [Streptomyces sp. SID3343]